MITNQCLISYWYALINLYEKWQNKVMNTNLSENHCTVGSHDWIIIWEAVGQHWASEMSLLDGKFKVFWAGGGDQPSGGRSEGDLCWQWSWPGCAEQVPFSGCFFMSGVIELTELFLAENRLVNWNPHPWPGSFRIITITANMSWVEPSVRMINRFIG